MFNWDGRYGMPSRQVYIIINAPGLQRIRLLIGNVGISYISIAHQNHFHLKMTYTFIYCHYW
uniref:Uncharacterized protein n=1 Tax=Anguilla anguilla TaxID=7936 RepID=A0A0E9TXY9_ANGAN